MSDTMKVQMGQSNDWNREPTEQELAEVPEMSQAEMLEVMRSPDYKNSKLAQKLVAASLAKSNHTPLASSEPKQSGDELAAKRATITNMMRDPRYKSDAAYRYEVQQKLAGMTENDNHDSYTGQPISKQHLQTGHTLRVSTSTSQYHGVDITAQGVNRVQLTTDPADLRVPVAKKAPKEPFA